MLPGWKTHSNAIIRVQILSASSDYLKMFNLIEIWRGTLNFDYFHFIQGSF